MTQPVVAQTYTGSKGTSIYQSINPIYQSLSKCSESFFPSPDPELSANDLSTLYANLIEDTITNAFSVIRLSHAVWRTMLIMASWALLRSTAAPCLPSEHTLATLRHMLKGTASCRLLIVLPPADSLSPFPAVHLWQQTIILL